MESKVEFASHVFTNEVMGRLLGPDTYRAVTENLPLSPEQADQVADAMKTWALSLGVTHYCHWFQPLTGATAEKHMSFLSPAGLLQLTGKQLQLGESDASSFPTGGLRQTAYARGFTAWDRTSPVFIKNTAAGQVLCIPTVFYSQTGDALDFKTPLLKSMAALNTQALRILRLFGKDHIQKVTPMVGAEQEYFLIDRALYLKRRDLHLCGRTLFGAPATKGQEMDDQYYAAIPAKAGAFMQELNRILWRMGIPVSAQHNEVAPAQHELAPHYTPAHIAVDQNQLIMETMRHLAPRHGLQCLLHEKPFARINGSGKHNNWSLMCDNGENLLEPGESAQFFLILACILQAVDKHADLLRLSAASVGNDHRLGGQEAPIATVSVFLGQRLESLLQGKTLPSDADDRNRTSPMAFTGNKFEFRMVGAPDSIATVNTVLNTIVAEAFCLAADTLETAENFDECCEIYIRELIQKHRRIIFSGDSYSPQWQEEAEKRGLPNLPAMVDAIPALVSEKAKALFEKFGVFSPTELESRALVLYETYVKRLTIEAGTMLRMAAQDIFPAVLDFFHTLSGNNALENTLRRQLQAYLQAGRQAQEALNLALLQASQTDDAAAQARYVCSTIVPAMQALRRAVDELELLTPRRCWPMPSYEEILFSE